MPPIYMPQELWNKPETDSQFVWIVTTNGLIHRQHGLIMGAGAALQARQKFPNSPKDAAKLIKAGGTKTPNGYWLYGLVVVYAPSKEGGLAFFQTKYDPLRPSEIDLIKRSAAKLAGFASDYAGVQFRMNFPGVGLGRLKPKDVMPYLEILPQNVTICFHIQENLL